jgi:hypothetical protein
MTDQVVTESPNEVEVVRPHPPVLNTAIFVRRQLEGFQAALIADAQREVEKAGDALTEARLGLEVAERVEETQASRYRRKITRLTTLRNQAVLVYGALEAGFIPMPTLPAVSLEHVLGMISPEALMALEDARETGLFEAFRVVDGRDSWANGDPKSRTKPKHRDLILVGRIGGKLFPLAWWV